MRRIELHGKHAVGEHRYALVDDEDYAELAKYRWKAKPNGGGNHVYAIRTQAIDGKTVDVRMHREVLGLARSDPRDVDHINHNSLDNRRENLRACSRSVNIKNSKTVSVAVNCAHCNGVVTLAIKAVNATRRKYCSETCKQEAHRVRCAAQYVKGHGEVPENRARRWFSKGQSEVWFYACGECERLFTARRQRAQAFCSPKCFDRYRGRGGPRPKVSELPCPICQEHFRPTRKGQRYCGRRCRKKAERTATPRAKGPRPEKALGP